MKQCTICKKFLPKTKEFFNSDRQKKDGLCPYCKICRNSKRKTEYQNSPEQRRLAQKRSMDWFANNQERARQNRKNQYWNNREKHIADSKEWRIKNHEKYIENNNAYYRRVYPFIKDRIAIATRNRRARIAGLPGKHTKKDIENMLIKQSGRCFYCGVPLYTFQVDHVVPVSRGGANSPDNLVLACEHCNKSKGARLPEEWKPIR